MRAHSFIWILLIGTWGLIISARCSKKNVSQQSDVLVSNQPAVKGRLVFHSYTCYSCNDSKLFLYDFSTDKLTLISEAWGIGNPMNAHFSPDGKSIVFMGTTTSSGWDVFRWRIGSASPYNLTAAFGATRDEDPKYSSDGKKVVFKQNGVIKEMDTLGNIINIVSVAQQEASMPYYTRHDSVILYSGNELTGTTSDIYKISLLTDIAQPLSANAGVEEYYPIAKDDTSFLFTRWYSAADHNDQVYLGFFNGKAATRLPFNETGHNFSDAYPINNRYVILSSTRPGGTGGYDLYVADMISGEKWSLRSYNVNINSAREDLGAAYFE